MDIDPFIKLLNTDEKSVAKSVIVTFPSIYLILYLFIPDFPYIEIIPSIIISVGVTTLVVLSFTLVNRISNVSSSTNITITQVALLCVLSMIIGYFFGFKISIIISAFFGGVVGSFLSLLFLKKK